LHNSISITKEGNREQGTGNREQGNREQGTDKKQKLLSLKLSQKKDVFTRCVARKKTVSLFQSHVLLKHEFFLFRCCPFPVPSEFNFYQLGEFLRSLEKWGNVVKIFLTKKIPQLG
jgi:hypothetical protein